MKCYFRKFVVLTVSCAAQLWVPPSVSQRCSMRWLASCPPTLLPASPAVFSITMRSCGVVNLPTKTPLSPLSLCSLCLSLSTFPHSSRRPSPSLADTCRRLFVTSLQLSRPLSSLHWLPPSCFFFFSPQTGSPQPCPTHPALWSLGCRWPVPPVSPEHQSSL